MKKVLTLFLSLVLSHLLMAEDGYDLWLRYKTIEDKPLLTSYRQQIAELMMNNNSATLKVAKEELLNGLKGLLNKNIQVTSIVKQNGTLIVEKIGDSPYKGQYGSIDRLQYLFPEGYEILSKDINGKHCIVITGHTDIALLYGVFHFLRLLQTHQPINSLNIYSRPEKNIRMLDHWDNLNRYVERGYAGISIWNWHTLPDYKDPRYKDYARANASIGINAVSLTNVNANAVVLTKAYLEKVAALADIFRPYGIKVFLTARFSAPIEIGQLSTADPLNDSVRQWWKDKAKEIYKLIPDFGGFLVKANSEGQPGPQNYGRDHADGANMLADAVAPFNGIVMWRAFVYDARVQKTTENFDSSKVDLTAKNIASPDRFKQAYNEFHPLDGKFRKNVLIQVKNGPIDFQPREPFSPLFGAMQQTPLMMEFQLTQEYLGQGTHLVYEATLFKEVLDADTYKKGKGTEVYKTIDGMAAVSNIGNERNWTGHPFGQANWYAFGRLSWNPSLSSEQIADEWVRMTFSNDAAVVQPVKKIMMGSRETMVNYMTPLGLHHIMGNGHHYGPAPWSDNLGRPDWNPVYYHKADAYGIGFDRTANGTNALAQYAPEVRQQYEDSNSCDDKYLLWFHHVSWSHKMHSGRSLWDELCFKYQQGVNDARVMEKQWNLLENKIDNERFEKVKMLLAIQVKEAIWWKNACTLYFQTFSKKSFPSGFEKPDQALEYYKSLRFPYAPGN